MAKPAQVDKRYNEDGTRRKCGAKKKNGELCRQNAMRNGRCKHHGGMSTSTKNPKGQAHPTNLLRHGIYAQSLSDEERELARTMQPGSVAEELVLCRLRLRRALEVQRKIDEAPLSRTNNAGMELSEVREEGAGNAGLPQRTTLVRKRADVQTIIDRLLGRIESLEKTQRELSKDGDPPPAQPSLPEFQAAAKKLLGEV